MKPTDDQAERESSEDDKNEELLEAAQETAPVDLPPEVAPETAQLAAWDEVPGASGREVPKVLPEDEIPPVEQFVSEGMNEAEREQRIAAAESDDPL